VKIAKLEIADFRAFPGPSPFIFEFQGGRNLLLYGENGSGKSSVFRALIEIFDLSVAARSFGWHRNIFSSGPDRSALDGFVALELDDGRRLEWRCLGKRPNFDTSLSPQLHHFLVDASRRKAFLDYRALLRTNFSSIDLREQLFELAVSSLLANVPVVLVGGRQRTVGQLWQAVLQSKPTRHTGRQLRKVSDAVNEFNVSVKSVLPDLETKTAEILALFAGANITIKLDLPGVRYNGAKRSTDRAFINRFLDFEITFCGRKIPEWNDFLNEARLSAFALSLYFAATFLSNPAPPPGADAPLKLLVLDDVLIGLDLSNRLPVLEVLEKSFGDYQILLSTFDRVWFEMAQLQTQDSGRWIYQELFTEPFGADGLEIPVLKSGRPYLEQAKRHLQEHDYKAAAVYARAAFETRLQNFCSKKRLPVPYNKDKRKISAEDFWRAVTGEKGGDGITHVDPGTKAQVEALRKVVLNPLSHAGASSMTTAEVQKVIRVIETLALS
jgi:energy-coupling factor transporter ATP-binding protein EcfA2